jgi:anti-sigma B factor antagonist
VTGDLALETTDHLKQAIQAELARGHEVIRVDLGQVAFIDSFGLAALISVQRKVNQAGARLEITAASDAVLRLLVLTGTQDVFDLRPQ